MLVKVSPLVEPTRVEGMPPAPLLFQIAPFIWSLEPTDQVEIDVTSPSAPIVNKLAPASFTAKESNSVPPFVVYPNVSFDLTG